MSNMQWQEMKEIVYVGDLDDRNSEDDKCVSTGYISTSTVQDQVGERYSFSQYLIDPNRPGFGMIIRIINLALKFIRLDQFAVVKRRDGAPVKRCKAVLP